MFGLGVPELLIILVILLLLFGGAKLPQLSRSIGQSLREIRRGVEGEVNEPPASKADDPPDETNADTPPKL